MTADTLIAKLDDATGRGPTWRARCPSCGGTSRKLSVREEPEGRVLLHCFAGCGAGDVVAAVGLDLADLFPPRAPSGEHRASRVRKPWRAADVLDALRVELGVAWVILSDVASGRSLTDGDRARAGVARDRVAGLIAEVRDAH